MFVCGAGSLRTRQMGFEDEFEGEIIEQARVRSQMRTLPEHLRGAL